MIDKELENILEILELSKTKKEDIVPNHLREFMKTYGLDISSIEDIDRKTRIDLALTAISNGCEIEIVVHQLNWKDFEGFVARVLEENDYRCTESFRRRGNKIIEGMEIDVIGVKGTAILAIDAKMWGIRSGKASALREAIKKQKKRTQRLSRDLVRLSKKIPDLRNGTYYLKPIMVTWLVEEVEFHEGVPVVPIFKLNAFLLEVARFDDLILTFKGYVSKNIEQSQL